MKKVSATFLYSAKTFKVLDRKLPTKYAVVGMPHLMPAFAYLNDTYRDDLDRLNDCNSYRVFPSLKQALEFLQSPYGHKGTEAGEALADQLIRWGVIEQDDEE